MSHSHGKDPASNQSSEHQILGIDFGGTYTKIGLFNSNLVQIVNTRKINTNPEQSPQLWSKRVLDFTKKNNWEFDFAGISAPSAINYEGIMLNPPNLQHQSWNGCKLADEFLHITDRNAVIANDGDCASYFAHRAHFKEQSGNKTSCFRGIGTGLAGAFNIRGEVLRGRSGVSSEAGHTRSAHEDLIPSFLEDTWSQRLNNKYIKDEELFCRTGTIHLFKNIAFLWPNHPIAQKVKEVGLNEASKLLLKFVKDRNQEATQILRFQMQLLGRHLSNVDAFLHPDAFILGGGLFDERENDQRQITEMLKIVTDQYEKERHPQSIEPAEICIAKLGNDAQLHGAAIYAKTFFEEK